MELFLCGWAVITVLCAIYYFIVKSSSGKN